MALIDETSHRDWLEREARRLVDFGRASVDSAGGFFWLDDAGQPDKGREVALWISCRMTHVFALAELMGMPDAGALVDHGIASLLGPFRDERYGGWFASIGAHGAEHPAKEAYAHAFVILAASSAVAAGHLGAVPLLGDAIDVHTARFWDAQAGMAREAFDRDWTGEEPYRGANANMHTVEAYLAAADVMGEDEYLARAERIVTRVVDGYARAHGWRVPEHFTPAWVPQLDYNADAPAHPFRPFGATVGHGLEWARLTIHLEQSLVARGLPAPAWMAEAAAHLYRVAVRDGWNADGAEGFVYTVDWSGRPVVRERMHWVMAEAIGAAAVLHARSGLAHYARDYEAWWGYAREFLIDREGGSWHHELDASNEPSRSVWQGKPDLYHALQATLIPRLPLAPSLATALARGLSRS